MWFKSFRNRALAIIAVLVLFCAGAASAYTQYYTFEGRLVDLQERAITVVNQDTQYVTHIIVPASINLTPSFHPGMEVKVYLTKTSFGAWNLKRIEKL